MASFKNKKSVYNTEGSAIVFNINDVESYTASSDDSTLQSIITQLTGFVKKIGDTMSYLNVSTLNIYGNTGSDITFSDGTIQNTAYLGNVPDIEAETITFTENINNITPEVFSNISDIATIKQRTQNILSDGTGTIVNELLTTDLTCNGDIHFSDGTIQRTAYLGNNSESINNTDIETETITFTESINNITPEVFSNINEIADIQQRTQNITSTETTTEINDLASANILFTGNINNITPGTFSNISDIATIKQNTVNIVSNGLLTIIDELESDNIVFTETINEISPTDFAKILMITEIDDRTRNLSAAGSITETHDLISLNIVCLEDISIGQQLRVIGNSIFQGNMDIYSNMNFYYDDNEGIEQQTLITGLDFGYLKEIQSKISYNSTGNLTTISGNTYLNSFTAGNINTAHLTGTSNNLQGQINTLNTKTTNMTYNINTGLTTIGGTLYINSFTAGNINTAHLNNTSQNIQTQINTANSNIASNTSSINTNTSNIATNTSDIATNTSDIATNTSNIASNTSNISTLTTKTQNITSSALSNTSITGSVNVSSNVSCNTLTVASSDINTLINGAKSYAYEFTFDNNEMIGENSTYLPKSTTYNDTYLYSSNLFADSANNIFNSDGTVKTGKYQVTLTYGLTAFYSLKKLLVKFEVRRRSKSNPSSGYLSWYSSLHHGFQNNGSLQYPQYGGSSSGIFTITTTNGNLYDHLIYTRVECDIFTEDFNSNNSQFQGKLLITEVY